MSRMRDGKSDWQTRSRKDQKHALETAAAVYGERCTMCGERPHAPCVVDTCPWTPAPTKPRAKPVQREATEARHLAVEAYRRWWYPGFRRVEHPAKLMGSGAAYRADRVVEEGARSGCPDFELWVPAVPWPPELRAVYAASSQPMQRSRVICALELKALGERPRRKVAREWWLEACDGSTHYGLRPEQRHWLRTMAGCGARTMVAYSGADALAWLDAKAGDRPEVMPW